MRKRCPGSFSAAGPFRTGPTHEPMRGQRPASASLSIPGDDRAAHVEVIVQTDANDLFAKRGGGGEDDRRNGGRRDIDRAAAEIDIEVFELDAPVRAKH